MQCINAELIPDGLFFGKQFLIAFHLAILLMASFKQVRMTYLSKSVNMELESK